ncbi:uncharacterized protein MKK02DRAFT_45127 [Dioszegia hungarica]|uniref:F-box domain-containing protein n=1 Tax=Dioszegia hungarica TaxID=4972 RepID=A0AA38LUX4_9TREE|nr:uncharacterized protein MKK02DRAFT_45127 [Dioszegia hungarica]KAI9636420.1 hypothetical protein MKK02DRAFT_45127 [Dioszegia hungarica]
MTSITSVPVEVCGLIVAHIPSSDRRTLYACMRLCRSFYAAASPLLYHTITLSSYSHVTPLLDTKPTAIGRGALSKYRKPVAKSAVKSKPQLLQKVRVLEMDGRIGGPFGGAKAVVLPNVRTLRIDMSLTTLLAEQREAGLQTWLDPMLTAGNYFDNVTGVKPQTIVVKHLAFHEQIEFPNDLPLSTLSNVTRIIYILDYTTWDADYFGRVNGRSNSNPSFGLHNWLDNLSGAPDKLINVDIVFWTAGPGLHFSTPGNKYTYMRRAPGQTWLDSYATHIAETFPSSDKINFNFVNTGSFDRHSISAEEWNYSEVEEAFRKKVLGALGAEAEGNLQPAEVVSFIGIPEWMGELKAGGVIRDDVLTEEEAQPWLQTNQAAEGDEEGKLENS